MHRYKVLIKYSQLQVSISPFIDEESVLSNEKYSSSPYLAPGIKCNNNVRASSANPSSLGHESGFQSSSSLRSLTPPLLAGSLCEYPIRAMDNSRGNNFDCQIVVHIICISGVQHYLSSDSMASLTSGINYFQLPGLAVRRYSLNRVSNTMSGSNVSLVRRSAHQLRTKDDHPPGIIVLILTQYLLYILY